MKIQISVGRKSKSTEVYLTSSLLAFRHRGELKNKQKTVYVGNENTILQRKINDAIMICYAANFWAKKQTKNMIGEKAKLLFMKKRIPDNENLKSFLPKGFKPTIHISVKQCLEKLRKYQERNGHDIATKLVVSVMSRENEDPLFIINGKTLTAGQAMTVRPALNSFYSTLKDKGLVDD